MDPNKKEETAVSRKLQNKKLHNLYLSLDIRTIKARRGRACSTHGRVWIGLIWLTTGTSKRTLLISIKGKEFID